MTGKSYDIKASLMDYSARWYSPTSGRFTTQDTWPGQPTAPQTLNRYAYALNNPVNIIDPTGHSPCRVTDTGETSCAYNPPDDWNDVPPPVPPVYDPYPWDNWGPPPPDPDPTIPPPPTPQEILQAAMDKFLAVAGRAGSEVKVHVQSFGDYAQGFTCALGKNVSFNIADDVCQDDIMSSNDA